MSAALPLLDRLIGAGGGGVPTGSAAQARLWRDAVRRDLENLLNTRLRFLSPPAELVELERSLVNYGVPDFAGASFADPRQQAELERLLEKTIRHFEPRLHRLRVQVQRARGEERVLRFRIDAAMQIGDQFEPAVFESRLDARTSTFYVGSA
ncbi:MAG: type VI secretion system baseplate subunit TssE [Phycisphaerae bacterium]